MKRAEKQDNIDLQLHNAKCNSSIFNNLSTMFLPSTIKQNSQENVTYLFKNKFYSIKIT